MTTWDNRTNATSQVDGRAKPAAPRATQDAAPGSPARTPARLLATALLATALVAATLLAGCAGAQDSGGSPDQGAGGSPDQGAAASPDQAVAGVNSFLRSEGGLSDGDPVSAASWYRAGDAETDWYVIFANRANLGEPDPVYVADLQAYVEDAYKTDDLLGSLSATEWHRIAIAARAAGADPTAFGTDAQGKPINLLADGTYDWVLPEELSAQGSNALIYAIFTMRGGGYDWPADARYTEDAVVSELLDCQNEAGAFGLEPGGESVDLTAMALQALAFYHGEGGNQAASALSAETASRLDEAVERAVSYLSSMQNERGCYDEEGVDSSESCSQTVMALCALGIDPSSDERFVKGGISVVDALMSFRNDDGGFASRVYSDGTPEKSNTMASRQAGCALTALTLYRQTGEGNFYSFNNTLTGDVQKAA